MVKSFARSRSMDALISSLDGVIAETGDYFDDELTAQLNIIRSWLHEAMVTIRQRELQRLRLVELISSQAAVEARTHETKEKQKALSEADAQVGPESETRGLEDNSREGPHTVPLNRGH